MLPGGTIQTERAPWNLNGTVKDGILSLDFADTLKLTDRYSSDYTEGVKISRVFINDSKYRFRFLALHKLEEDNSGVIMYYTNKDLTFKTIQKMEYQLKAGWNFFDEQKQNTNSGYK